MKLTQKIPYSLHSLLHQASDHLFGYRHIEHITPYNLYNKLTAEQAIAKRNWIHRHVREQLGRYTTQATEVVESENFNDGAFNFEATVVAMSEDKFQEFMMLAYEQGARDMDSGSYYK